MDAASQILPPLEATHAPPHSQAGIALEGLVTAVGLYRSKPISLSVQRGQTLSLVGANGAGKSTLLDTIAGFLAPRAGRVWIAGRDCTHTAPELRRVGYLFQRDALFPHRTVAENLQFGRLAAENLTSLLDRFGLDALASRRPGQLSGGERQRVALARALAGQPDIVLLDEPLSAIDPEARPALRDDLARHLGACEAPSIIVTHDPAEAMALGHMVAVMHAGELLQFGPCSEVFARPNGMLAGKLLGVENIWQGKISNLTTTGLLRVRIGTTLDTVLDVSSSLGPDCAPPVGSPVHVYARATNVSIMPPQACMPEREGNFLRGRLLQRRQLPTFVQLRCEIGPGVEVLAYAPGWQWREWLPATGDELCIHVHPADLHVTML